MFNLVRSLWRNLRPKQKGKWSENYLHMDISKVDNYTICDRWNIFYYDSVALNLLEFLHILTYQTSSDQNAAALPFLCPNLKPEQESGHLGLLLLLGTLFKKEEKDTCYNIHVYPQAFSQNFQLHLLPISHWTKKKNLKHTHLCLKTGSPAELTKIWNQSWPVFLKSQLSTTLFLLLGTE